MCPSGGSNSTVTHRLVFDMKKVGRVFPIPQLPPPAFLLCDSDIRADIKFLSTSSGWGIGHVCRHSALRPCRRVAVFPKHATPLSSFCSSNCFHPSPPSLFPLLPSLVFHDCLRKMTVPPQLAGLWLTETNK